MGVQRNADQGYPFQYSLSSSATVMRLFITVAYALKKACKAPETSRLHGFNII